MICSRRCSALTGISKPKNKFGMLLKNDFLASARVISLFYIVEAVSLFVFFIGDYLTKNYPLLTKLPITVEYYKNNSVYVYYIISYQVDKNNQPTVIIKDFTGGNYDSALTRIKAEGFEPNNYKIEYQDKKTLLA